MLCVTAVRGKASCTEGPVGAAVYTGEHTSGAKWRVLGRCSGPREPEGSSALTFSLLVTGSSEAEL